MNNRNEAETRAELIDPALKEAGWGVMEGSRIRREVISDGRLIGDGRRTKQDIADYVLVYRNQKLAVIEAKREGLPDTEGLAQAKRYAKRLHVRYAISTNGHGIYLADMEGKEGYIESYPTPEMLWKMVFGRAEKQERLWRERFAEIPFEDKGGQWQPRYYQHNAVTKALEAIGNGKDRILLTLATGTGKTAIAFQIAWKLFHSRWNLKDWREGIEEDQDPSRRPRILFLADRNILADQAFNAFSAFPEDALVRISPGDIRKKGRVPKNGSIFFTIFQTFMSGEDGEGESQPYFGEYPPDFFDFIVIDECHRGGANSESSWRSIMEYFAPAIQLGLTATPKREANKDTYLYFGEPVYVYSLKEGINDGYLTPFRVRQIHTTLDKYRYNPDDEIIEGEIDEKREYSEKDFNRTIEISAREKERVRIFMDDINQREKTLVFCATQAHALAIRDYINQIKRSKDPNYCVRVTAFDGTEGERWLKTFQDNEKTIPTILTTSYKLSTGVDARNVRNIVLLRPVNNIVEFKQIVGRGTRLYEGKNYFTLYDFVEAYKHFNDPEWDGPPAEPDVCPKCGKYPCECKEEPPKPCPKCGKYPCECPKEPCKVCGQSPCICNRPKNKIKVRLSDGRERTIDHMVATSFYGPDGKPMASEEFLKKLFGELPDLFKDENELRKIWSKPDTRRRLLQELKERGFGDTQLADLRKIIDAEKSDLYDVLSYVAYAQAPLTRKQRVDEHSDSIFSNCTDKQREFLSFVLDQYIKEGVSELDDKKLPSLIELKYDTVADAIRELGKVSVIRHIFINFQRYLYEVSAVAVARELRKKREL